MRENTNESHRALLQRIARDAMSGHGFEPKFAPEVHAEVHRIQGPAAWDGSMRDLRALLWCSIDNDDSLDLDQLSMAEALPDGATKILVAVADVDALVPMHSAIDKHAEHNTTSVYTPGEIFPMLPEQLSTDMTSLNPDEDRVALVIDMTLAKDGSLQASDVYRAVVRNHAKLAYNSVAAWLEGTGEMPAPLAAVPGLDANIRLQHEAAEALKKRRHENGALNFETIKARPTFEGEMIKDLRVEHSNSATQLIEEFMVCANGVIARYLFSKNLPSFRRVVRVPKRWDRIVQLASENGHDLPENPDSKALDAFLLDMKAADPEHFPDLSLSIIKLMGPGEYIIEVPGAKPVGHFGLAVKDYSHSTAPNRRYPDLITHRLVKAAMTGAERPYGNEELETLAFHCTLAEDNAKKVERQVDKSAQALVLEKRIGEEFDALVTGASEKGTWVRLMNPPVEGRLMEPGDVDVGDKLRVRLDSVNVERGFIDFLPA